ncbi:glycosyl hydrolase-related protein [Paenibacillus sp. Soil787]|uniref:glycoside hydrolase family 38 N-terminal domain-containing protein n=1 Tax=Paenibacillus sp. Soil787 TaxID=1736411 RepID=UPI000700A425|nr:glycosyl hydrolase-related protein [Paenibacillus sp. Soil787]KRF43832.1 hypothetical protein ASG93_02640 [Paenibacillus sp. Soil787]
MSKIKEVLILHHSHLDVGYTHAQPILLEMQKEYIDQALLLCESTEHWSESNKFRWTCEATYPVLLWLELATEKQITDFKRFLANGQMSIAATYLHTTPLCTPEQITRMLYPIRELRERLGCEIKCAINHDINGQPWPYSQLLLDAGVEFYITGINIHMGGIPLTRPSAFHWQAPDGRKLLSFNGEHYSLFSQICYPENNSTDDVAKGLTKYLEKIEANPDYPFDFIYLTSTNIPAYDNNSPDKELAELFKVWNEEQREITLSFVTPEQLYAKVKKQETRLQTHAGDWTDYWNFGSASSAKETKLNRRTKQGMKAVDLLEAFGAKGSASYVKAKKQAWDQINLYDEHTWGVWFSIADPNALDTDIQWAHKAHYAYLGNSLTGYLLGTQMEKLADNPQQSREPEGIMLVNPSSVPIKYDIKIPSSYLEKGRHLYDLRSREVLMNNESNNSVVSYGTVELPAFSWLKLPIKALQEAEYSEALEINPGEIKDFVEPFSPVKTKNGLVMIEEGLIETPFHRCSFDPSTGRILSLYDKGQNWEVLDSNSPYSLFQYVQETIDPLYHPNHRRTLFPRDIEKSNNSISCWNNDWKAKRETYTQFKSCKVERSANSTTLILQWDAFGVDNLEQSFTFFSYRDDIEMKASFYKQDITTPEGTYFAIPLNVQEWRCHYDTAGQWVELDAEQLPGVCRDYLTVDKSVSVYDDQHGVTLVCSDAPLVQVGDFNFGKEQRSIDKQTNPLLLAWPMNNYWETNFRARQPGYHTFTYYLSTFKSFKQAEVMESAIRAVSPILTYPVIHCKEEEAGQFLQVIGEGVQVFDVKPAEEGAGIVIRLSNCTDQPVDAQLNFPNKKIIAAYQTNALEEIQSEIKNVRNETLEISLQAKQMLYFNIILNRSDR